MNNKPKYKTKQRDILINYLETVQGKHITVNDVCMHFENQGNPIGQTTVYRQLERMVDEGICNKYVIDVNSPACFEYMGQDAHGEGDVCFHAKCEKCGKLFHMHCEELFGIQNHLLDHHDFVLDPKRTVFYGMCRECRCGA